MKQLHCELVKSQKELQYAELTIRMLKRAALQWQNEVGNERQERAVLIAALANVLAEYKRNI